MRVRGKVRLRIRGKERWKLRVVELVRGEMRMRGEVRVMSGGSLRGRVVSRRRTGIVGMRRGRKGRKKVGLRGMMRVLFRGWLRRGRVMRLSKMRVVGVGYLRSRRKKGGGMGWNGCRFIMELRHHKN